RQLEVEAELLIQSLESFPPLRRVLHTVEDPEADPAELFFTDPVQARLPGLQVAVPALDKGALVRVAVPGGGLLLVPAAAVAAGLFLALREALRGPLPQDR